MLEVKDTIITHDIAAQDGRDKKIIFNDIVIGPENIIDYTFPFSAFMLPKPEPVPKSIFGTFRLGKIFGSLRRKDLYEDR